MNKLDVLVSLVTDDNDFQLEQAASAQSAAAKLGVSVQIIYSGNDAVQQTQQILSFIQDPSKRPDAILVEPSEPACRRSPRPPFASGIAWCPDQHRRRVYSGTPATCLGSGVLRDVSTMRKSGRFKDNRLAPFSAKVDAPFTSRGPRCGMSPSFGPGE